jgi:hypothetical protein
MTLEKRRRYVQTVLCPVCGPFYGRSRILGFDLDSAYTWLYQRVETVVFCSRHREMIRTGGRE